MKCRQCYKYLSQTDQRLLVCSSHRSVLLTLASQVVLRLAHTVASFALNIFTASASMRNLLGLTQTQSLPDREMLFEDTMHQIF